MRFGSLFSGIGGLDLGLERAGMTCAWQVEVDEWCRAVLARHWPDVPRWDDARTFPPGWSGLGVDLICGGFPCQPVSHAGKRLGQDDERWLWPEFARIVRVLRPRCILVENVPGLLSRGMGDVLGDLAASGYDCEWDCIPAAAVGAPHLRYRVFIVAYAQRGRRLDGQAQEQPAVGGKQALGDAVSGGAARQLSDTDGGRFSRQPKRYGQSLGVFGGPFWNDVVGCGPSRWWAIEPDVGRVAHGIPSRVDRLRGLGNAVVPQVAEWIGRRLMEIAE